VTHLAAQVHRDLERLRELIREGRVLLPEEDEAQGPQEPGRGPGAATILEFPNRLFREGDQHAAQGHYQQAIAAWQAAVEGDKEAGSPGYEGIIASLSSGPMADAARANKLLTERRIAEAQTELTQVSVPVKEPVPPSESGTVNNIVA